jgi:DNA polymerase III delta prime subunit
MVAADFSDYLKFILTDPRYSGTSSFYTATDALLALEAEIVKQEELPNEGAERTPEQIERLPVLEMLRKYGLGEKREHLLLAGKPGSGKSTTLRRLCVELAEIALADELQPIPVFVQLKGDKPLLTIIKAEFRRAKLKVTEEQIDDLLLADKLVLLLDGVNEIPSEQLRRELQDFRENNLTTPTIFTTRDLTMGGSLGIDKRLEMRPLTNKQMREFVHKYLPEYGDKLLGQLRDQLREIAETPLLLKMLCEVFDPTTGQIPQNKGELFELFDRKYQCHKEGVAVSDNFRRFQSEVLQYLGFTMLQGDTQKPTEAWLTLPRQRAEGMLEDWLKQRGEVNPASKAKEWLEDLVEHHLLQVAADPQQIEFHHQLFQEYYAARHLKSMLQGQHSEVVEDERLKHFYLNYLKWTEPLGLLLGLLDNEAQALRLVRLGLEVDWFLGARLAGEVKQEFQSQTVKLVNRLIDEKDLPQWLRFELWEKIRSSNIIPDLSVLLKYSESDVQIKIMDMIHQLIYKDNIYDFPTYERRIRNLFELPSLFNFHRFYELGLGPCKAWEEIAFRDLNQAKADLINWLVKNQYNPGQGILIILRCESILPFLYQVLAIEDSPLFTPVIFEIQAKCEFYNYNIFHSLPTNQQSSPPSLTLNIDKLGNLNTGTVNVQGNQIGIQQPADPQ